MTASSKTSLIPIMNGQYEQIYAIELAWGIRLREGDMRPRIEYFHDAVRALTSGQSPYEKTGRLSVQQLAWDVAQLREVPHNPFGRIHDGAPTTAGDALVTQDDAVARGASASPRQVRAELAQLYKDYTVLFVALFAETADINFRAQQEEVDTIIADIGQAESVIKRLGKGEINPQQAQLLMGSIEQDSLREQLNAAIANGQIRTQAAQMLAGLKGVQQRIDAEFKATDQAHMHYATSRLAVYEESKDLIKRLGAQGLNLAGKFVEAAMTQGAGRGKGRDF